MNRFSISGYHKHILTGNLKIIDDNKLRKHYSSENDIADYQTAKESIITGINSCIQSWCDKNGVRISLFSE